MLSVPATGTVDDVIVEVATSTSEGPHPEIGTALLALSKALKDEPRAVMRLLVESAMSLTSAQSCGISLLEASEKSFRWVATCGEFEQYLNSELPREFSPCGTVLDRQHALLMTRPERYYGYVADIKPPVHTLLLVPFCQDDKLVGTIWVVKHTPGETFDSRDLQSVKALADFASAIFESASLVSRLRKDEERAGLMLQKSEDSRRLLEVGFQHAPGFFALLRGEKHVFELANEAYARLVGKSELVGKSVLEAIPELAGQGFDALLDRVFKTGEPYVGADVKVDLVDAEGTPYVRYVDFVYQPLLDQEHSVIGIFIQGNDVTQQHLAIQQLQVENDNKEKFLSVLSHELKNPLSSIRLAAQLLRHTHGKDDARQQKATLTLDNQTAVLSRLVNDLVDVESIRVGKFQLDVEDVRLQSVFASAIESTQQHIAFRGHTLEVLVGNDPLLVRGDVIRLVQVFTNLLTNASKYSAEGSNIVIKASSVDGVVVTEVVDEGIGIESDFLPHIFDVYTQAQKTDAFHRGGMGLGLALVRQLVELHQGSVVAKSGGLGKGASFIVTLPAAVSPGS
jgi:signal transduction histidine kinase